MSWREDKQSSTARGYDSRWRKARLTYLKANPYCVMCREDGIYKLATVVDHIVPHRGNQKLFWDKSNWQSLCAEHHSSTKQRAEKSGRCGCDADGIPLGWSHHWNNKK